MGFLDWFKGKPSKTKFAKRVIKALRQAGDTRHAAYDPEGFRLVFRRDGEECGSANLHNVYGEHCERTGEERTDHFETTVKALLIAARDDDQTAPLDDVRERILPAVRERAFGAVLEREQEAAGGDVVLRTPRQPIGKHLAIHLVVDEGSAMSYVSTKHLEDWNLSLYEALEIAKRNLADLEYSYATIGEGVYCTATNDNYDSSRIILLDMVREWKVKGDHVAMVPNRDSLIVTGMEDDDGLEVMANLAEKVLAGPRPLSGFAFRLEGDDWTPWLPGRGHPLYRRFKNIAIDSYSKDYHDQKQALDRLHERRGEDIFVATYMVAEHEPTARLESVCVWTEGVHALLPEAEFVTFVAGDPEGEGGPVACGRWDKVRKVVGDLMEPLDCYPPRHRVRSFPTGEQLREIGETELFA